MKTGKTRSVRDPRALMLNILIGALALIAAYLLYTLAMRVVFRPPVEPVKDGTAGAIQVDVLNGCGASDAARAVTGYLRSRGFDVVEMRNYKTFDVPQSLVVDRTGDRRNSERVAYALGIKKENIIQQVNQDYYVDVSVVIGRDYATLKSSP